VLLSLLEPDIQPFCPLFDLVVVIDKLPLRLISWILVSQARTQLLVVRRLRVEVVQETLDIIRWHCSPFRLLWQWGIFTIAIEGRDYLFPLTLLLIHLDSMRILVKVVGADASSHLLVLVANSIGAVQETLVPIDILKIYLPVDLLCLGWLCRLRCIWFGLCLFIFWLHLYLTLFIRA